MKKYEKEAFFKTFGIFFATLMLLTTLVASFYYSEQKHIMEEQIFSKMKSFTYDFQNYTFEVDVIPYDSTVDELNLQPCDRGMCGYFAIPSTKSSMFKVIMSDKEYKVQLHHLVNKVLLIYSALLCAIIAFSLFYSFYALYPLKHALYLLESFLKDMIHDLNTPITSILLNTKSIAKTTPSEALERIDLAAKTIASLYRNLEILHQGFIPKKGDVDLEKLLHVRAKLYQKLYPKLTFVFETEPCTIHSDPDSIARIFDNLISNACKYNRKNGSITLSNSGNIVNIRDTGIGIKNCSLVYERYYKENEKGLGLGLNIVKKLCDILAIKITLESHSDTGTSITLLFSQEEKV